MANPNLTTHLPIIVVGTRSGNQEAIKNILEAAGQVFVAGSPVQLNVSGNVVPWDGATILRKIEGVTLLNGQNFASAGQSASPLFGSIGQPGGTPVVTPAPQNQPNAFNVLAGSLFTTGLSIIALALPDIVFEGQVDASAGGTFNATQALVGTELGLTVDGNGTWYLDLAKNTPGTNTVVKVDSLNPLDLNGTSVTTQVNNGRVRFTFNPAASAAVGA